MARPGLAQLIAKIRSMTGASTDDYTVAGMPHFSDDDIADYLDRHRLDFYDAALTPVTEAGDGGTTLQRTFYAPHCDLEQTDGGTAVCVVRVAGGAIAGTAHWSADYTRGVLTFAANQAGTSYALTGRSYDLYGAAADLLDDVARYEKLSFDISTDNDRLARSQKVALVTQLADDYRRRQRVTTLTTVRSDLHGNAD